MEFTVNTLRVLLNMIFRRKKLSKGSNLEKINLEVKFSFKKETMQNLKMMGI